MKYLVLGSEGQIGTGLCSFLEEKGEQIIRYDIERNSEEDLRDVRNIPFLLEKMEESDFVFVLSWDVGGSRYLSKNEKSYEFISNNVSICNNVFYALRETRKKFIFVSSQLAENENSTYGKLKIVGEEYTKSLNGLYVRLWNVFGQENHNLRSHVITDLAHSGKYVGLITVLTDGEEERQFLHVDDCSEALYLLSNIYNSIPSKERKESVDISSFEWIKIKDVAKIISEYYGSNLFFSDKKDKIGKKVEPNRKILKIWKPKKTLEEGIECVLKKI